MHPKICTSHIAATLKQGIRQMLNSIHTTALGALCGRSVTESNPYFLNFTLILTLTSWHMLPTITCVTWTQPGRSGSNESIRTDRTKCFNHKSTIQLVLRFPSDHLRHTHYIIHINKHIFIQFNQAQVHEKQQIQSKPIYKKNIILHNIAW